MLVVDTKNTHGLARELQSYKDKLEWFSFSQSSLGHYVESKDSRAVVVLSRLGCVDLLERLCFSFPCSSLSSASLLLTPLHAFYSLLLPLHLIFLHFLMPFMSLLFVFILLFLLLFLTLPFSSFSHSSSSHFSVFS